MSFGIIFKTEKSGFRFGISAVSMMVFMSVDISISLRVKTKIIIIKSWEKAKNRFATRGKNNKLKLDFFTFCLSL